MSLLTAIFSTTTTGVAAAFIAGGAIRAAIGDARGSRRKVPVDDSASDGGLELRAAAFEQFAARTANSRQIVKRARTGRLPLPERVTALTPEQEPALDAVNAFVDRLAEVPAMRWVDVGRSLMDDGTGLAGRTAAFMKLETTIHDRGLAMASWYVRDAVETSAFLASSVVRTWSARDGRAFAAAHAAAEESALALLAREGLSSEEFRVLYTPFGLLVPVAAAQTVDCG